METAVRWPVRSASRAASVTTAAAKPSQEVGPVDVPAATAAVESCLESLRTGSRTAVTLAERPDFYAKEQ